MPAARRTGPRKVLAAQIVISACKTAEPYRGGRCLWICFVGSATRTQSRRRYLCPAWCRTRAAYLRQYPVDSQKSSSICDFLLFVAFQYACAFTIVSFFRSRNRPLDWTNILGGIVSSIPAAPFLSQGPAVFCHCSGTFSHEFTEGPGVVYYSHETANSKLERPRDAPSGRSTRTAGGPAPQHPAPAGRGTIRRTCRGRQPPVGSHRRHMVVPYLFPRCRPPGRVLNSGHGRMGARVSVACPRPPALQSFTCRHCHPHGIRPDAPFLLRPHQYRSRQNGATARVQRPCGLVVLRPLPRCTGHGRQRAARGPPRHRAEPLVDTRRGTRPWRRYTNRRRPAPVVRRPSS